MIENVIFDCQNDSKLNLVHALSGSIYFKNCEFRGGINCIKASGYSTVHIDDCIITLAKNYGVYACDQSQSKFY